MNNPPAVTKVVNPTIKIIAKGSSGLLEPGANLTMLILKARLFRDRLSRYIRIPILICLLCAGRSLEHTVFVYQEETRVLRPAFPSSSLF
jgi:hypothetical protein